MPTKVGMLKEITNESTSKIYPDKNNNKEVNNMS